MAVGEPAPAALRTLPGSLSRAHLHLRPASEVAWNTFGQPTGPRPSQTAPGGDQVAKGGDVGVVVVGRSPGAAGP